MRVRRSSLVISPCGLFQSGNVDLVHFHQRVHDARCFRFIGIGQHIAENDRVDLPGESEFVFEPVPKAFGIDPPSTESFSQK